jgi:hypothetical protein
VATGTTCVEDRVPSPPPPPPPPEVAIAERMLCSELVSTRTNVRDLDPPTWCNSRWSHRNPITCATLYGPLTSDKLSPCVYDPVENTCTMKAGEACIEDRF